MFIGPLAHWNPPHVQEQMRLHERLRQDHFRRQQMAVPIRNEAEAYNRNLGMPVERKLFDEAAVYNLNKSRSRKLF